MTRRWIILLVVFAGLAACVTQCTHPKGSAASSGRTASAREFVQLLADGRFSRATAGFDDAMTKAMSPAQLQQLWETLIQQQGSFKGIVGAQPGRKGGYDTVDVTCEFARGKLNLQVVFNSAGRVSGLWILPATESAAPEYTPPAYVQKDRFEEKEVTINKGSEWELPGTLTIPKGEGPFPAVVLVHGSGPEDRDEMIGPNRPFKDIAWGLASRGIAVLRYEKRSKVYGPKMATMATMGKMDSFTVKDETIDDALAAVKLLRNSARIDPKRIFVLGHSLGGMLLPRIGKADPKITGLIMMAGCVTQPLEAVLLRQFTYIASLSGPITDDTRKEIDKQVQTLMKAVPASYNRDLDGYIPVAVQMAESLKQPMLIIQGARDYQATTADFNTWKAALSSRKDIVFKLYPDLNHLFMTGKGMATPSEYEKPGSVAETAVNDIASWINGQ